MTQSVSKDTLLATQAAFVARIPTIKNADDLSAFIKDVDVWLHSSGVSNRVVPKAVDGAWRLRTNDAPFDVTEGEQYSLACGIRAFTFNS
jgi:hypothetical protein